MTNNTDHPLGDSRQSYPPTTEITDEGWKINWKPLPRYNRLLSMEAYMDIKETYLDKMRAIPDFPCERCRFKLQLSPEKVTEDDVFGPDDFYTITCLSRTEIHAEEAVEFFSEMRRENDVPNFIGALETGATVGVTINGKKGIVCKDADEDREREGRLYDEFYVLQIQMKNIIGSLICHHIETHTSICFAQLVVNNKDFKIPPSLYELSKVIDEPSLQLYMALHIRRNNDVIPEGVSVEEGKRYGVKTLLEFLSNAKSTRDPDTFKRMMDDPQELMEYAMASTCQSLNMRKKKAIHRLFFHIALHNEDFDEAMAQSKELDTIFNDELNVLMEASQDGEGIYGGGTCDGMEMTSHGEEVIRLFGKSMVKQHKDRERFVKNLRDECGHRLQVLAEQSQEGVL